MDYFLSWLYETDEFVKWFINDECTEKLFAEFISSMGYSGEYELSYSPLSATELVFLNGDENERYSFDEISYMDYADRVIAFNLIFQDESLIQIFHITLSCAEKERDFLACALVKLFNKAFKTINFFIFHCDCHISFGTKVLGRSKHCDDFCISNWYSSDHSLEVIEAFSYLYVDGKSSSEFFENLMSQVLQNTHLITLTPIYEKERYNSDYIGELLEVSSICRISFEYEINHYIEYFNNPIPIKLYRSISDELSFIVSEQLSSYDYLELAEKAEADSKIISNDYLTSIYDVDHETAIKVDSMEEAAFSDAEKMLDLI